MQKALRTLALTILLTLFVTSLPASAASTALWSTASKSQWVEAVGQSQLVTTKDGEKTAAVWLVRTSRDTSKLYAKVKSEGDWSATELVADFPWDWHVGFRAQITGSGRVLVGVSDSDYALKVYERLETNSWKSIVVDNDARATLGAFAVGGTVAGELVTFTNNIQVSERQVILKSWSIDFSAESPEWTVRVVRNVTRTSGEFSACTYNKNHWSSCAIGVEAPQILTMSDGAQVLLVSAYRSSSTNILPGTQSRTFMAHRSNAFGEWVWKGSFLTQTMTAKDESIAYFTYPAVVNDQDRWAIAVTTGSTSTRYNTVRVFSGTGAGALPTASDSPNLAARKGTDNPILLADGASIKMAFENNGKTFLGSLGKLSSAARMPNVANGQVVKSLLQHNGVTLAIIQTPSKATYLSRLNGKTWSAQIKLMGYADQDWVITNGFTVNRNNLIVVAPKITGKRQVALYLSESAIKP